MALSTQELIKKTQEVEDEKEAKKQERLAQKLLKEEKIVKEGRGLIE